MSYGDRPTGSEYIQEIAELRKRLAELAGALRAVLFAETAELANAANDQACNLIDELEEKGLIPRDLVDQVEAALEARIDIHPAGPCGCKACRSY